ncbi:unnamed protein product [Heterobilharzia americana]|nr:unnamed protein product [Heterobilharzia americana]
MNASVKRERMKPSSSSLRTTPSSSYNFATRLKNRVCSNSCLKIVYLSCATLISASFIIECILLHLIIAPYLSESIFEEGMCKYSASRREESSKRCENKCSKERSTFPCLQLKVIFTPIRTIPYHQNQQRQNKELIKRRIENENYYFNPNENSLTSIMRYTSPNLSNYTVYYDFGSSESRMVYLYDYFSTFAAHKTSRVPSRTCGISTTSPFHSLYCSLLKLAPQLSSSSHFFLTPSPCHPRMPNSSSPLWAPTEGLMREVPKWSSQCIYSPTHNHIFLHICWAFRC